MNKRLPYEEELSRQLNDLPLPDENISWEDMNRRLEGDDDNNVIIPPAKNWMPWLWLFVFAIGHYIIFIARPDTWNGNTSKKSTDSIEVAGDKIKNNISPKNQKRFSK